MSSFRPLDATGASHREPARRSARRRAVPEFGAFAQRFDEARGRVDSKRARHEDQNKVHQQRRRLKEDRAERVEDARRFDERRAELRQAEVHGAASARADDAEEAERAEYRRENNPADASVEVSAVLNPEALAIPADATNPAQNPGVGEPGASGEGGVHGPHHAQASGAGQAQAFEGDSGEGGRSAEAALMTQAPAVLVEGDVIAGEVQVDSAADDAAWAVWAQRTLGAEEAASEGVEVSVEPGVEGLEGEAQLEGEVAVELDAEAGAEEMGQGAGGAGGQPSGSSGGGGDNGASNFDGPGFEVQLRSVDVMNDVRQGPSRTSRPGAVSSAVQEIVRMRLSEEAGQTSAKVELSVNGETISVKVSVRGGRVDVDVKGLDGGELAQLRESLGSDLETMSMALGELRQDAQSGDTRHGRGERAEVGAGEALNIGSVRGSSGDAPVTAQLTPAEPVVLDTAAGRVWVRA